MTTLKPVAETTKKIMSILGGLDEFDDPAGYKETKRFFTQDRQHIAEVLCELLEGEIQDEYPTEDGVPVETYGYEQTHNQTIRKAQALIRQTLDPISNQE